MPKSVSLRVLIHTLRGLGFDGSYSGGRHLFMSKSELKVHVPNLHRGDVSAALISEILRQAGISRDEWNKGR